MRKHEHLLEKGKSTRFKKGNKMGARNRLPDSLKGQKKLTQPIIEAMVSKLFFMEVKKLKEYIKDEKTPVIEVMFASSMLKAIAQGDVVRINALLDRVIGKVVTKVEAGITATVDKKEIVQNIPDDRLIDLAKEAVKDVKQ